MTAFDFTDKVVLVTGAGGGIGGGIAKCYAEAGGKVYILDFNVVAAQALADELNAKGYKAEAMFLDATKKEIIDQVVDSIAEKEGHIDVLVNSAGMLISKPFMETTEDEFNRILSLNLVATNTMCQSVLRYMIPKNEGKIVNVASIAARHGNDLLAHYTASKFGVMGLAQSIALAVASHNINVNCVCPGIVRTPLFERLVKGRTLEDGVSEEEEWKRQAARIPLGRLQTPEDIGHACMFLSSPFGENITGQALNVCGGIRLN